MRECVEHSEIRPRGHARTQVIDLLDRVRACAKHLARQVLAKVV